MTLGSVGNLMMPEAESLRHFSEQYTLTAAPLTAACLLFTSTGPEHQGQVIFAAVSFAIDIVVSMFLIGV